MKGCWYYLVVNCFVLLECHYTVIGADDYSGIPTFEVISGAIFEWLTGM